MRNITSQNNPPKAKADPHSDVSIVETTGYIPAKKQIEDMLRAGLRLEMARRRDYHFAPGEEIPEDYVDPTTDPSFDYFEAVEIMNDLRLSRMTNPTPVDKAKAKETAEEGSIEPSEQPIEPSEG